jgi:NhaA family Na+:H+ antiporter
VRQNPQQAQPEGGVVQILRPFQEFVRAESLGGLALLAAVAVALIWANSPWGESYNALWKIPLGISFGSATFSLTLHYWINDGLMAIFFFVVGLEIKRELLVGELASPRRAVLPVAAALGGMALPAAIYTALNYGTAGARGWGIPMATDIAFALGVLALMGSRVPTSLKVFLASLAIVDDLGAVLVIALFYTSNLSWVALAIAAGIMVVLILINRAGVLRPWVYIVLGIGLWLAILASGIHATVAGVLLALTIPASAHLSTAEYVIQGFLGLRQFAEEGETERGILSERQRHVAEHLQRTRRAVQAPLQRLEHILNPWVAYAIVPLFALANAGVSLRSDFWTVALQPVALGVMLGLVIGKQAGITLFAWLSVKMGLASLPSELSWIHIYGVAWLGGIGFTMSLFIAELAFNNDELLTEAKIGILVASVVAASAGWFFLHRAPAASEANSSP